MSEPDNPDDIGWGQWPIDLGSTDEALAARRAARAAEKAEQRLAAGTAVARQEDLDAARASVSARKRKTVTEDAQKKIRRDLAREKNVPEPQRNLRAITALRMRRNGASNTQIAKALGYKSPTSVSTLIGDALKGHVYDQHEIEVYRDYFLAELLHQAEIAVETVQNPGYLYDVKGELVSGPDGQFLENISERTKAQTEWRHIQESARKLLGVDAPQKKIRKNTIIIKNIREAAEQLGIAADSEAGMDIVDADVVEPLRDGQETGEEGNERGGLHPVRPSSQRPQQGEEQGSDKEDQS